MQYRNGQFISTGAAVTLMLGFVPDKIQIYNYTVLSADSATPAVGYSLWINNVVPSANALIDTYTSGAPVTTLLTSNGVTPIVLGADWQNTQYVITGVSKANPGVVTVSSATPTNTIALENGMTVTISNVVGMTQLNTNRYIVANVSGATFSLYDLFGHPVNTTAFGTYVSGGIVNQISYPPTAPVLNSLTGQVITPGQPAGLQYDIGYEGVILGSGVVGANTNVMWWEAFYSTPTGW